LLCPKVKTVSFLVFWLSISLADFVCPVRPYQGSTSNAAGTEGVEKNAHLAMAFSGGGYRAGLFLYMTEIALVSSLPASILCWP
jgi:hypothetical protein